MRPYAHVPCCRLRSRGGLPGFAGEAKAWLSGAEGGRGRVVRRALAGQSSCASDPKQQTISPGAEQAGKRFR
jgi:hypothetical protein